MQPEDADTRASGAGGDGPDLAFDQLLEQLVDRAQDVMAARNRLRGLLRATRTIVGELDLDVVLRRIVEAACELVDAPFGALGVIAPDGSGLEQFVHVGLADAVADEIGHLPEGKGLLGALIHDPRPIRLRDIADDARSAGFPPGHPPMRAFLGAPIRVRDEVFGNLYLARVGDEEFSADDEELVTALAANAGVAIDNARLYERAQRRQAWLEASTEVTRELLTSSSDALRLIARRVLELADADVVAIAVPTEHGSEFRLAVAVGHGEKELTGERYPVAGTMGERVLRTGEPTIVEDAVAVNEAEGTVIRLAKITPVGPVALVPLTGTSGVRGVLQVARRHGRRPFPSPDVDMITTFANHASIALELADARRDAQRMATYEDRARIARDLHDHVIQQLFAAGMTIQNVRVAVGSDGLAGERLDDAVDTIDDAIRQIRTSIFQLQPHSSGVSLRSAVLDVASELSPALGFDPRIDFRGPVDSLSDAELVGDVVAVVREALTNVAKHARATTASVAVSVESAAIVVTVVDDGVGVPAEGRRSGLSNLQRRAEHRSGQLLIEPGQTGGTVLTWVGRPHRA